jgi:hypothetical protein
MKPELEAELRTTVASLRVRTACQDLLILALLPTLPNGQKEAIRERLDLMEVSEVVPSRLVDQDRVESETPLWIQSICKALAG